MQYLTYFEYRNMGGNLTDAAFLRFEFQSRREIDRYTFQRIFEDTKTVQSIEALPYYEPLRILMFELIALYSKYDLSSDEKTVSSTSNNGISVNYHTATVQEVAAERKKLIRNYLSGCQSLKGIDLLWAGV